MINQHEKQILRRLAAEIAEIAALPVQEEKRTLWTQLNRLKMKRPMVEIDQVCWHEMPEDELALRCEDPMARLYEQTFRRVLYQWRHFPVDRVVDPFVRVPMAISNSGFGIETQETIALTDAANDVVSHAFVNQFERDEDLEKIRLPVIRHDVAETERRMAQAHELFDGLIEVRAQGMDPYLSVWDPISMWMGVENVLYALVDRPEFMLAMARRMVSGYMAMLDQLEEQGLLTGPQSLIHCTGAFTDELPAEGFQPEKPRTKDIWMFGLAQMFSTVSPDMFDEYEIDVCMPLFQRFGLVYYGCCDPLDRKMEQVMKIPNVRKISVSPWADEARSAEQIGARYVYSRKPNPALLADFSFDDQQIRRHLETSIRVCRESGSPLELILKDISTVKYEPSRLDRWAGIAMDLVQS